MVNTTLEQELLNQCAALCMDMKVANTLIINKNLMKDLKDLLADNRIQYIKLGNIKDKLLLLLYDKKELDLYLQSEKVEKFLISCGYQERKQEDRLYHLKERYELYQNKRNSFPHEMGVFLGYPLEDIIGFINNEGRNYLFSGYWKVYNQEYSQKMLFYYYKEARKLLSFYLEHGISLKELL